MKNLTSVTSVRSFVQSAATTSDEVMIGEVVNLGKTGVLPIENSDVLSLILMACRL